MSIAGGHTRIAAASAARTDRRDGHRSPYNWWASVSAASDAALLVGSRRYFFVSGGPAYVQLPIRQPSASFRNANVICAAAWTGTPRDLIEYVTFSTT